MGMPCSLLLGSGAVNARVVGAGRVEAGLAEAGRGGDFATVRTPPGLAELTASGRSARISAQEQGDNKAQERAADDKPEIRPPSGLPLWRGFRRTHFACIRFKALGLPGSDTDFTHYTADATCPRHSKRVHAPWNATGQSRIKSRCRSIQQCNSGYDSIADCSFNATLPVPDHTGSGGNIARPLAFAQVCAIVRPCSSAFSMN